MAIAASVEEKRKQKFQFPDIYVILSSFIILVALLTWVVPAGQFERDTVKVQNSW